MISNTYIVRLKRKKNFNNETIDTMIATKEIPKIFLFPLLKMSLHGTVYRTLDGDLEAEGTK
jgi:hypothetical protein